MPIMISELFSNLITNISIFFGTFLLPPRRKLSNISSGSTVLAQLPNTSSCIISDGSLWSHLWCLGSCFTECISCPGVTGKGRAHSSSPLYVRCAPIKQVYRWLCLTAWYASVRAPARGKVSVVLSPRYQWRGSFFSPELLALVTEDISLVT